MIPQPLRSAQQRSRGNWIGRSFLTALLLTAGGAAYGQFTLPAPLRAEGFDARQVGGGLLTWFGFEIYDASLWTPTGEFQGLVPGERVGAAEPQPPVAFSLWYHRGFSRERLIDITQNGWNEFKLATPQQQAAWSAQLGRIWVDTQAGSNMTTLVLPSGETRFYNAERYLGSIHDVAFGAAFLSIWLDPRTRGTRLENLRTALLGLDKNKSAVACTRAGAAQSTDQRTAQRTAQSKACR